MPSDLRARLDQFIAEYDHPYAEPVRELLNDFGELALMIFGAKADEGLWRIHETVFGEPRGEGAWRHYAYAPDQLSRISLSKELECLHAYAHYGLILDDTGQPILTEAGLADWSPTFPGFYHLLEVFGPEWSGRAPLEALLEAASARLAIDGIGMAQEEVTPEGLAILGGVSLKTIKNLLSPSAGGALTLMANGRIPVSEARNWLAGRPAYRPSVWQLIGKDTGPEPQAEDDDLHEVLFVPRARDGSLFIPDLARKGHYTVGPKGEEEQIASYREALDRLTRMRRPSWRRPNEQGNWGIVVGTEWVRTTAADLGL